MPYFHVDIVLRYTRFSCAPMRAKLPMSKTVLATDDSDALRQACLCVDRDLEEILAQINAINVSEVVVEVHRVEPSAAPPGEPWNGAGFDPSVIVPPYVLLRVVRSASTP